MVKKRKKRTIVSSSNDSPKSSSSSSEEEKEKIEKDHERKRGDETDSDTVRENDSVSVEDDKTCLNENKNDHTLASTTASRNQKEKLEETRETATAVDSASVTTQATLPPPPIAITVFNEPEKRRVRGRMSRRGGALQKKTSPIPRAPPPSAPPAAPPPPPPDDTASPAAETAKPRDKNPLTICTRGCWRGRSSKYKCLDDEECSIKIPARGVVFVTNTEVDACEESDRCQYSMRRIQKHHMDDLGLKDVAYNWVVGGDLVLYEGLGWDCRSPAATNKRLQSVIGHHLYIGFIGRYIPEDLPTNMLNNALAFIYLNIERKNIIQDYKTEVHEKLFMINNKEYDVVPYL